MSSDPEFVTFALDLLSPLGPVRARAMFGGYGLYARGVMFALLDADELFLKTDDACRARFVDAGCRRWTYGRMQSTSYFRPPDDAHEDPEAMLPWARLALDAALRAAAAKAGRPAKAGAQRKARPRTEPSGSARKRAPRRAARNPRR
jgi:DNA transformation protein